MKDDQVDDLKQFISTTITQQISQVMSEQIEVILDEKLAEQTAQIDEKFSALDQKLTSKIDDLSAFVGEALDASNETNAIQLKDHESRITKLEQSTV